MYRDNHQVQIHMSLEHIDRIFFQLHFDGIDIVRPKDHIHYSGYHEDHNHNLMKDEED